MEVKIFHYFSTRIKQNFDADDAFFWPSSGIRRLANVAHTIFKKMKEQLLKCLEGYFMVDVFVCIKTHYVFLRPLAESV
jgi:hypothetical protein